MAVNGNGRAVLPKGITDTQSYTWVLREAFLGVVSALPFFAGYTIKRNRRLPIQTNELPVLGVYIVDEMMTPDGDANAGEIRFLHTFRIGFSVVIANNDDAVSEQTLDAAFWAIMNGLWRNESVTQRRDTVTYHQPLGTPDNVRFEAVVRGTRKHMWGSVGLNQETDTAELQYECSVTYRAEYGVPVTDDLNEIDVTTNFPSDHSGDPADVEQVEVVYELNQTKEPSNGRHPPAGRSAFARRVAPSYPAKGRS